MPVSGFGSRSDIIAQLQRLVGVDKWLLNLQTNVLRVEFGRDFNETFVHDVTLDALARLLSADDMRKYRDHWHCAIRDGHAGPVLLPFVDADGTTSLVDCACALHLQGEDRYLIGVFRRSSAAPEPSVRSVRQLAGFLEAFIENSPSSIVVTDPLGKVVSANRQFLRFFGKVQKSEVVNRPVLDTVYELNSGLGTIVRDALRMPDPSRGRYEFMHNNGMRQTLYWRAFPLSVDANLMPPKVFAFDLNEHGPRAA